MALKPLSYCYSTVVIWDQDRLRLHFEETRGYLSALSRGARYGPKRSKHTFGATTSTNGIQLEEGDYNLRLDPVKAQDCYE